MGFPTNVDKAVRSQGKAGNSATHLELQILGSRNLVEPGFHLTAITLRALLTATLLCRVMPSNGLAGGGGRVCFEV